MLCDDAGDLKYVNNAVRLHVFGEIDESQGGQDKVPFGPPTSETPLHDFAGDHHFLIGLQNVCHGFGVRNGKVILDSQLPRELLLQRGPTLEPAYWCGFFCLKPQYILFLWVRCILIRQGSILAAL